MCLFVELVFVLLRFLILVVDSRLFMRELIDSNLLLPHRVFSADLNQSQHAINRDWCSSAFTVTTLLVYLFLRKLFFDIFQVRYFHFEFTSFSFKCAFQWSFFRIEINPFYLINIFHKKSKYYLASCSALSAFRFSSLILASYSSRISSAFPSPLILSDSNSLFMSSSRCVVSLSCFWSWSIFVSFLCFWKWVCFRSNNEEFYRFSRLSL